MSPSRNIRLRKYVGGKLSDDTFDMDKSITTIGRDVNCDIRIQDGKTSRLHCEIIIEDGFCVMIDRHSTNGTYVNNARVVHHIMEPGDIIQIGNTHFLVEDINQRMDDMNMHDRPSEVLKSMPVKEAEDNIDRLGGPSSAKNVAGQNIEFDSRKNPFLAQSEYFNPVDVSKANHQPKLSGARVMKRGEGLAKAQPKPQQDQPQEPESRQRAPEQPEGGFEAPVNPAAGPPRPQSPYQKPKAQWTKIIATVDSDPQMEAVPPPKSIADTGPTPMKQTDRPEMPPPPGDPDGIDVSPQSQASVSVSSAPSLEDVNELRVMYRNADKLNRLSNHEELYDYVCASIFDVFGDVEYLTLAVHNTDDEKGHYSPVRCRTREKPDEDRPFPMSRSLIQNAIRSRSGILAGDAADDQRWDGSASLLRLKIKSVMCAPLVSGNENIGLIYIDNRSKPYCFNDKHLELFTAMCSQFAVTLDKMLMSYRLNRAFHETMLALINALEAKDAYTKGHTQRVCQYALGIGRQMGLSPKRLSNLQTAAMLHDIGKVGIKQGILNKTGSLSETEFVKIKNHVEMGCYILKPIAYLKDILPIIRAHHERWDGGGYPDGIAGEEIPLEGRILAVADSLDAMTSKRSYNEPISKQDAVRRCKESVGKQFDPEVVEALERYMGQYDLISSDRTFIGEPAKFMPLKFEWEAHAPERNSKLEEQKIRPPTNPPGFSGVDAAGDSADQVKPEFVNPQAVSDNEPSGMDDLDDIDEV